MINHLICQPSVSVISPGQHQLCEIRECPLTAYDLGHRPTMRVPIPNPYHSDIYSIWITDLCRYVNSSLVDKLRTYSVRTCTLCLMVKQPL